MRAPALHLTPPYTTLHHPTLPCTTLKKGVDRFLYYYCSFIEKVEPYKLHVIHGKEQIISTFLQKLQRLMYLKNFLCQHEFKTACFFCFVCDRSFTLFSMFFAVCFRLRVDVYIGVLPSPATTDYGSRTVFSYIEKSSEKSSSIQLETIK